MTNRIHFTCSIDNANKYHYNLLISEKYKNIKIIENVRSIIHRFDVAVCNGQIILPRSCIHLFHLWAEMLPPNLPFKLCSNYSQRAHSLIKRSTNRLG